MFGNLFKSYVRAKSPFYITEPTWAPHRQVFEHLGLQVRSFDYLDKDRKKLNLESFLATLEKAPSGSVIVLHACAHNPSGCDPTREQWRHIGTVMRRRNLFPLFDAAYLGMVTGDLAEDSYAIRHFVHDLDLEVAICVSFAKIMGLYGMYAPRKEISERRAFPDRQWFLGERCGALMVVTKSSSIRLNVESQLEQLQRREISNPPALGARIAAYILAEPDLTKEWSANLKLMSTRIAKMRTLLRAELEELQTPGKWNHITDQGGMFCILGLSLAEVLALKGMQIAPIGCPVWY